MSVVSDTPWLVEDLIRVEDQLRDSAARSSDPLVSEACSYLLSAGGKRLRPTLVLVSSRFGRRKGAAPFLAAAAVELVHVATLYHDDIIDHTETRRGVPTVHTRWGVDVAVLAGDYLFAQGCILGARAGGEVPLVLAEAVAAVCEGQIVETAHEGDLGRSPDDYVSVVALKTAALFQAACELGAVTSTADDVREPLARYGRHLGIAFQIADDLLDYVGDPAITGKSPGTDLSEGVYTIPMLLAVERDPSIADVVCGEGSDLGFVLDVFRETGALEDSHEMAVDHMRRATEAVADLATGEPSALLSSIAQGVLAQLPSPATFASAAGGVAHPRASA